MVKRTYYHAYCILFYIHIHDTQGSGAELTHSASPMPYVLSHAPHGAGDSKEVLVALSTAEAGAAVVAEVGLGVLVALSTPVKSVKV